MKLQNSENSASNSEEPRQKRKYVRRKPLVPKPKLTPVESEHAKNRRRRDKLIEQIYATAMEGDLRAAKEWLEYFEQQAPVEDFNISVTVVPYEIADTSLKRIVAQADTPHVLEIFEGLALRLEEGEAPHELRDLTRCLREQYKLWAEKAYAIK
jgi:hypothetical protein